MIARPFWASRIRSAWEKVSVVWLSGVRRVGKTTLAAAIQDAEMINCDLPSSARRLHDPERFFASVTKPVVVLDEIHQLADPSRALKVGADAFPHLRILATGSSTLAATTKFRDSLTGRKRTVHLLPVLEEERAAFGAVDLRRRLRVGGLPEPLLAPDYDPEFYAEWLDSYFARDVQELFRVGKRRAFLQLVESLLRTSGGLLEITSLAKHCALSRPTAAGYLEALETTHVVHLLRPYHAGGRQELVRRPKAYGFDTGFVCFCRGWSELRDADCGVLWEHLVLDVLLSRLGPRQVRYWRDKQGHEVDFVVPRPRGVCDAIECKWDPDAVSVRGLAAFRRRHPSGVNYVVSPQLGPAYQRTIGGLELDFCSLLELPERLVRRAASGA